MRSTTKAAPFRRRSTASPEAASYGVETPSPPRTAEIASGGWTRRKRMTSVGRPEPADLRQNRTAEPGPHDATLLHGGDLRLKNLEDPATHQHRSWQAESVARRLLYSPF